MKHSPNVRKHQLTGRLTSIAEGLKHIVCNQEIWFIRNEYLLTIDVLTRWGTLMKWDVKSQ